MQEVDLSNNELTGTLPASLDLVQDLRLLDLSNNSLSGPLPTLFSADHMVSLDVSSNELTGTIPEDWAQSVYLSSMDLSSNSLSGSLPLFLDAFELNSISISFSGLTAGNSTNQRGVHLPNFAEYNRQGPKFLQAISKCVVVNQQDRAFLYFMIPFAVLMAVAVPIIVLWTRMSLPKYVGRWNRKKGPPESGQTVSLVLTDVEGSTELWEAFQEVMQVATPIHDRIMRAKISHYNGYEVTTEGDAFILAFHDPADAVAWCMATQQALLTAPWPTELIGHHRSSIRTSTKVVDSAERAVHLAASEVLFRGLRVRMGIGTGIIEKVQVHELTKRREYTGPVMDLAKAVSECPSGGQIVCCSATFASILDQQARILQQVPPHADHDVLYEMLSHPEGATDAMQSSLSEPMLNNTGNASATQRLLEGQTDPATTTKALAKPDAWVQAGKTLFQRATGNSSDKVKMLNMGQHILDSLDTPQQLYQLCIPGLENRAVLFPPLTHCTELAPGYFAAPAARLYPLSHRKSRRPKPLPPVTLVFCAIDGYHDVMAENHVHGELTTTQCYNACRQLLKDRNGYECGTEEGTFLAAFASGTDALQFCVVAQEVLLDTAWSQDALAFEQWKAILGKDATVAFRGPRVKMSIVQDIPTSIGPHPDTGCAMYHGPMAGSAAKLCHFVSHGGQIILPNELAEVVLADWTGSVPPMPSAGQSLFLTAHHGAGSNLTGSNWDSAKSSPASDMSSRRTSEAGEADKSKPKTSTLTTTKTRMAMEAGRGDISGSPVPLTKEAIKSAQLTYQGSFKDPEVLKHWSGSGNLRRVPSGPAGTRQHARISEDPFVNLEDKPRAPKHERAEGATRRASTNTAGVPLKSAVRRPSLGVRYYDTSRPVPHSDWQHAQYLGTPANFSQAAGWLSDAGNRSSDTGRNSQADYAPDTLDIDSLPGSVEATDASRKDSPQKSLVHGAFLRAASVHKTGKLDTTLYFDYVKIHQAYDLVSNLDGHHLSSATTMS
ncbi:MAG: adenylate cyclase [Trebouxia sp. A1-2]|nr:MAG: adenylate cyclase [Trebouxia sp. A1-2]